ncbi:hypothetical protein LG277_04965 [Vreelandella aquamarina]|uniref:hypothetical protein n=1 Tax=Vreelandella aquamarina TaxID=77097 RepID=UPI00384FD67A
MCFCQVKENDSGIVQVKLPGHTDLKTVTEAINEGAIYKFLTKPWDDSELRQVVRKTFQQSALQALS